MLPTLAETIGDRELKFGIVSFSARFPGTISISFLLVSNHAMSDNHGIESDGKARQHYVSIEGKAGGTTRMARERSLRLSLESYFRALATQHRSALD